MGFNKQGKVNVMGSITDVSSGLLCCPRCGNPSVVISKQGYEFCIKCTNELKDKGKADARPDTSDD